MDVNPIDVQRHLRGVSYPADRDDLIEHAEGSDAPEAVLEALGDLEPETFDGPDEVVEALGGG